MAAPFLALITPLGGDAVPPSPPLGIWGPTDPRPTPPVAGPGRPPWWGMANDPGYGIDVGTPPAPPLVIWGPGDPRPTLPIAGWDPGSGAFPKPPQPPLGTWGGAGQPFPTNPIAEPPWGWGNPPPLPTLPPEVPSLPGKIDWRYGWTPSTGWIVVGIPQFPVPTPSAAAPAAKK